MLFVAPNLANEEDRIDDDAGDDHQEEDRPEDDEDALAPVQHEPADVQRDGRGDQADPEDGKEDGLPLAARDHGPFRIPKPPPSELSCGSSAPSGVHGTRMSAAVRLFAIAAACSLVSGCALVQ